MRWKIHLAALAGAVALSAALSWGRLEPITILNSYVTPAIERGGTVQVVRAVEWNRRDCWSYQASTSYVDSLKIEHQVEAKEFGYPDYGNLSNREWPVPFTMPWGQTKLDTRLTFSCLPFLKLWPVVVKLPDVTFNVIPETIAR